MQDTLVRAPDLLRSTAPNLLLTQRCSGGTHPPPLLWLLLAIKIFPHLQTLLVMREAPQPGLSLHADSDNPPPHTPYNRWR